MKVPLVLKTSDVEHELLTGWSVGLFEGLIVWRLPALIPLSQHPFLRVWLSLYLAPEFALDFDEELPVVTKFKCDFAILLFVVEWTSSEKPWCDVGLEADSVDLDHHAVAFWESDGVILFEVDAEYWDLSQNFDEVIEVVDESWVQRVNCFQDRGKSFLESHRLDCVEDSPVPFAVEWASKTEDLWQLGQAKILAPTIEIVPVSFVVFVGANHVVGEAVEQGCLTRFPEFLSGHSFDQTREEVHVGGEQVNETFDVLVRVADHAESLF